MDQLDLLAKCNGMRSAANSTANQIDAIEELIPDDFSVARTQTLLFANTQYASIMDRLMALRGGARGLSLAGLNVIVDGKMVPLAEIEDMVGKFFGGGACRGRAGRTAQRQVGPVGARQLQLRREGRERGEPGIRRRSVGVRRRHRLPPLGQVGRSAPRFRTAPPKSSSLPTMARSIPTRSRCRCTARRMPRRISTSTASSTSPTRATTRNATSSTSTAPGW